MANWALPSLSSLYTNFITEVSNRDIDSARLFGTEYADATGISIGTVRWNHTGKIFEKWSGAVWEALSTTYGFSITGYATSLSGGNTTTLLGSIPYQSGVNTTTLLSPNTTSTKKFLSQTGTGTNGAIPTWSTLGVADVTGAAPLASPTFTGTISGGGLGTGAFATIANYATTASLGTGAYATIANYATTASLGTGAYATIANYALTSHEHSTLVAGNGITGTSYIGTTVQTWSIASHAGTAGSIGTINIGADTIGVSLGTTSTTACAGNDTRLSDSRTPLTHSHYIGTTAVQGSSTTQSLTGIGDIVLANGADRIIAINAEASCRQLTLRGCSNNTTTSGIGGTVNINGGQSQSSISTAVGGDILITGGECTSAGTINKTGGSVHINGGGTGAAGTILGGTVNIGTQAPGTSYNTRAILIGRTSSQSLYILTGSTANAGFLKVAATTGLVSIDTTTYLPSAGGTVSGATVFSNTTASTSYTTGAVTIGGGLGVAGAINASGDITAFASSDRDLKNNITRISGALDKVCSLTGNTFNWNALAKGKDVKQREAGVIAQEVQAVLPEVVVKREDGYLAVNYEKIIPLLIEAIKDLKAEIDNLKAK